MGDAKESRGDAITVLGSTMEMGIIGTWKTNEARQQHVTISSQMDSIIIISGKAGDEGGLLHRKLSKCLSPPKGKIDEQLTSVLEFFTVNGDQVGWTGGWATDAIKCHNALFASWTWDSFQIQNSLTKKGLCLKKDRTCNTSQINPAMISPILPRRHLMSFVEVTTYWGKWNT